MKTVALIETTRGLDPQHVSVENVHYGAVAVVDLNGKLLWSAGDANYPTFSRSTLKPFQALPFLLDGGAEHFGFGSSELALMCASHSGEAKHVSVVEGMLTTIGCAEPQLRCGCHAPLFYTAVNQTPPADGAWTQVHNNCSGKHSGFLAWCRMHDAPLDNYLDMCHPLQQRIRATVAEAAGMAPADMPVGTDGCSAPNYALPLARLAQLYARLAQGAADTRYGAAMGDLFHAMTGHPDLVSGTGRNDLAYMETGGGDWVTKVGADGVQVLGIRSAGVGIAVKIADGSPRALHTAVVAVLNQLGLTTGRDTAALQPWVAPAIRNHRGVETGSVQAVFQLRRA